MKELKALHEMTQYYNNPKTFFFTLMGAAFSGIAVGALIEQLILRLQGDRNSKLECIFFIILHLLVIAILLFVALRFYPDFGTWLQVTLGGLMFALTFFIVQAQLTKNTLELFA